MSDEENEDLLELLIFLKEKHGGNAKVRACADGQKHRDVLQRKYGKYPTLALELAIIKSEIDAHKRRDVAVVDIPGTLLTTDMDEYVIKVLQIRLAELILET